MVYGPCFVVQLVKGGYFWKPGLVIKGCCNVGPSAGAVPSTWTHKSGTWKSSIHLESTYIHMYVHSYVYIYAYVYCGYTHMYICIIHTCIRIHTIPYMQHAALGRTQSGYNPTSQALRRKQKSLCRSLRSFGRSFQTPHKSL